MAVLPEPVGGAICVLAMEPDRTSHPGGPRSLQDIHCFGMELTLLPKQASISPVPSFSFFGLDLV